MRQRTDKTIRTRAAAALLLMTALPVLGTPRSAESALDPSFGEGGLVVLPAVGHGLVGDVAIQADGKILAAGWGFFLARLEPNGTLDESFGDGGLAVPPAGFSGASDLVVQVDGKILVHLGAFAVARYDARGWLDFSFGTAGVAKSTVNGAQVHSSALALQPNGKIVVAGDAYFTSNSDFVVVRFNADGSRDTGFGTRGIAKGGDGNEQYASAVVVGTDGRIVVGGAYDRGDDLDLAIQRFTTGGTPALGQVTPSGNEDAAISDIALQADGKIVAAGFYESPLENPFGNDEDQLVARYDAEGNLDGSFGTGGIVVPALDGSAGSAGAVLVQPDGKILVVGRLQRPDRRAGYVSLTRYEADGSLDESLGDGGIALVDVSPSGGAASAIALQADGAIVVGATAESGGGHPARAILLRYVEEFCGDGAVTSGEECDDGNDDPDDCCSTTCESAPTGTSCDDGLVCNGSGGSCSAGGCATGPAIACGLCEVCVEPAGSCVAGPAQGCFGSTDHRARLDLRAATATRPARLTWEWQAATAHDPATLGDPAGAEHAFCLFDAGVAGPSGQPERIYATTVPGDGLCNGRPCWKPTGRRLRYRDQDGSHGGLRAIDLRNTASGKSRILVSGSGPSVELLPSAQGRLTAQLQTSDGTCWESTHRTSATSSVD